MYGEPFSSKFSYIFVDSIYIAHNDYADFYGVVPNGGCHIYSKLCRRKRTVCAEYCLPCSQRYYCSFYYAGYGRKRNYCQKHGRKEGAGSKIITILIVLVIVAIWVAVFGVLIKLNIGNFGSEVLYPVLKDIPVLNRILPDVEEEYSGSYNYSSVSEAVAKIKELEKLL